MNQHNGRTNEVVTETSQRKRAVKRSKYTKSYVCDIKIAKLEELLRQWWETTQTRKRKSLSDTENNQNWLASALM